MFNYDNWLVGKLYKIANELNVKGVEFECYREQDFVKIKDMKPNTIYIIEKYLSASKIESTKLQPIQLQILSEENGLALANLVFQKLADMYNMYGIANIELGGGSGKDMLKMQYTSPVVLNNFNVVGHGYRSVLYVSINLYILENVADIENLKIDNESISFTSCSIAYSMVGDSQDFTDSFYVKTERSKQSLAMSITCSPTSSPVMIKLANILKGLTTGNSNFLIEFTFCGISCSYNMKVSNFQIVATKGEAASIVVGFTV